MVTYSSMAFTGQVKILQEKYGSRKQYERLEKQASTVGLTNSVIQFIESRDSFYLASVGENGFPYIQHRGGPKGFLKALDSETLGFIDFSGNKQYITVGNAMTGNKVSLILMDYPAGARLKIYAEIKIAALGTDPELDERLSLKGYEHRPERIILLNVKAFDWNCRQHIVPRFTAEEIETAFESQVKYIRSLEQEIKTLRSK